MGVGRRRARRALVHTVTHPPGFGHCPVCGSRTVFVRTGASSREAVKCLRCRSSPRGRALFMVLDRVVPDWPRLALFEAGTGGALSDRLARSCLRYTGSLFLKGVPRGETAGRVRSEETLDTSRTRAEIGPDGVHHLHPPAFHDDVLDPAGVLVVTDWGRDLPARIREWSGFGTEIVDVQDRRRGVLEPIQILVSGRSPPAVR